VKGGWEQARLLEKLSPFAAKGKGGGFGATNVINSPAQQCLPREKSSKNQNVKKKQARKGSKRKKGNHIPSYHGPYNVGTLRK